MTFKNSKTYPKPPGQERSYPEPTKTGKAPFKIPNYDLEGETAYEIYGDLESGIVPLIVLHGGPGFPHDYLAPISLMFTDYDIPVVLYDQIGCGKSTHFSDRMGDTEFWTPELFVAELDNLKLALGIKTFNLLGHSWGGMLVAHYVTTIQPAGLRKLIIADSSASMTTWEKVANKLRTAMPADLHELMARCEKEGKVETPEYEAAVAEFNKWYSCRLDPPPKELSNSIEGLLEDPSVQMTMFGSSDFKLTGSLRGWTIEKELHKLTAELVPGGMLLMNGYFDAAQDECMLPYFKEPSTKIKWVRFGLSSHSPHLEETEEFIKALGDFLED